MIAPANHAEMTDEELLAALMETYEADAAQFVLDVLRGRAKTDTPIF